MLQDIKSDVSQQVVEVLAHLRISEDLIVTVLQNLEDSLNVVLLECSPQSHNGDNLLVVFVDLGFSGVGVVDL